MIGFGILRIDRVAEGAVDQPQRGAVHDVQNQIAENGQESRAQAQPEETGADQGQKHHERQRPRDGGECQAASYVRAGDARLEEICVEEGEAQTDGQMDGDRRVEDIGGVFDHDVIGQALEPHGVRLRAGLSGGLNSRQREGNAVRDYGGENHEYGGNKA